MTRVKQRDANQKKTNHHEPTVAPGMEMDELDEPATEEEVRHHDYTPVTKLFIDRVD